MRVLPLLLVLALSCTLAASDKTDSVEPRVQITAVEVQGPMPVVMAETMVKDALPTLLACWTEEQPPCGTITVGHQGTRHGHKKKSVEGSLKAEPFRRCVQDVIGGIRPPTPELSSPESGLTVTLVYAPSATKLEGCQS